MASRGLSEQLEELLYGRGMMRAMTLAALSDLHPSQMELVREAWRNAPAERRQQLLVALRELAEDNVEYNFKRVHLLALEDPSPEVRAAAVEGLWEEDEPAVQERLEQVISSDSDPDVRAVAATALGSFALKAVLGEVDADRGERVHDVLRRTVEGAEDGSSLQMRSVESLSYFDDDPILPEAIGKLYRTEDEDSQASALLAMGRCMDRRWSDAVIQELDSPKPRLRFHAASAAGEMSLEESVPSLARLVGDEDFEVREAAIRALGQIASPLAVHTLRSVIERSDEDEMREAAEEALSEAAYLTPLE